jgi:hypothetical protein
MSHFQLLTNDRLNWSVLFPVGKLKIKIFAHFLRLKN